MRGAREVVLVDRGTERWTRRQWLHQKTTVVEQGRTYRVQGKVIHCVRNVLEHPLAGATQSGRRSRPRIRRGATGERDVFPGSS